MPSGFGGFKSLSFHNRAFVVRVFKIDVLLDWRLAQKVEQKTVNLQVVGSSPMLPAKQGFVSVCLLLVEIWNIQQ